MDGIKAEHRKARAEEARVYAEEMASPEARRTMLVIASRVRAAAQHAEERENRIEPKRRAKSAG